MFDEQAMDARRDAFAAATPTAWRAEVRSERAHHISDAESEA